MLQESTKGDKCNKQGHAVKEGLIIQPADDRVRYENGHRVHVGNGGGENNQEVHPNWAVSETLEGRLVKWISTYKL